MRLPMPFHLLERSIDLDSRGRCRRRPTRVLFAPTKRQTERTENVDDNDDNILSLSSSSQSMETYLRLRLSVYYEKRAENSLLDDFAKSQNSKLRHWCIGPFSCLVFDDRTTIKTSEMQLNNYNVCMYVQ